jgi:hypothetical protein
MLQSTKRDNAILSYPKSLRSKRLNVEHLQCKDIGSFEKKQIYFLFIKINKEGVTKKEVEL